MAIATRLLAAGAILGYLGRGRKVGSVFKKARRFLFARPNLKFRVANDGEATKRVK